MYCIMYSPGTQNWTQPAPQMPSAPFYSSPNQSTKPAARIGWQQRSGWHKVRLLVSIISSTGHLVYLPPNV